MGRCGWRERKKRTPLAPLTHPTPLAALISPAPLTLLAALISPAPLTPLAALTFASKADVRIVS
jgi:hypothetical protein